MQLCIQLHSYNRFIHKHYYKQLTNFDMAKYYFLKVDSLVPENEEVQLNWYKEGEWNEVLGQMYYFHIIKMNKMF